MSGGPTGARYNFVLMAPLWEHRHSFKNSLWSLPGDSRKRTFNRPQPTPRSLLHLRHPPSPFDATITGTPGPMGAPGHACHYPLMPLQPLQQCAIGGVPQIHFTIIATADQARAVRTPRHVTDPGLLPTAQPTLGARRHFP